MAMAMATASHARMLRSRRHRHATAGDCGAPSARIDAADSATDMMLVKRTFPQGILAQPGAEP
ncbi:hypothetical protein [Ralstonia pseudosolanacearum]|nr:hypothetical protein [Ralstonia pseudosolanacearum]KAF3462459.1 cob(I)yrinic acid a [Ralstonia solanacearum]MCK4133441.1 hypothetical protein [Ralstonia pseudosolanacearum]MDK1381047.1 hypothetical protein [Ralstonia pseudosolanacearum]NKA76567.1 c-diamide adenosyltransferase [Ralstonia solanacearum]NKG00983.1 c-diamide adenosyltransferase [Ralstonia solanacearum]